MKCTKCGYENPDNVKFCNECGEKFENLKIKCSNCGAENNSMAKFCNECGRKITQLNSTCPECGYFNAPGAKFCDKCGHCFYDDKPKNKDSVKKCPNCGYHIGEERTCESCGYSLDSEPVVLNDAGKEILARIEEDERDLKFKLIIIGGIVAFLIIAFIVIVITNSNSIPSTSRGNSISSSYSTSSSTAKPKTTTAPASGNTSNYKASGSSSQYNSSYDGKITKSTKLPSGYPGFIEIVSYCEVDMPRLIKYDASISLDESYTSIVKTGLRYKLETSRLKLKSDGSYHSAILILEFDDSTYKTYHYTTIELDGVKLK